MKAKQHRTVNNTGKTKKHERTKSGRREETARMWKKESKVRRRRGYNILRDYQDKRGARNTEYRIISRPFGLR